MAASVALGVVIHWRLGNLEGPARLRAFAAVSLAAAGVLTWMIFWMRRQARAIKGELEHKVDAAVLTEDPRRAVVAVTFLAVIREGIEAALFLIAVGTSSRCWPGWVTSSRSPTCSCAGPPGAGRRP